MVWQLFAWTRQIALVRGILQKHGFIWICKQRQRVPFFCVYILLFVGVEENQKCNIHKHKRLWGNKSACLWLFSVSTVRCTKETQFKWTLKQLSFIQWIIHTVNDIKYKEKELWTGSYARKTKKTKTVLREIFFSKKEKCEMDIHWQRKTLDERSRKK